jgi:hypothetical protein
VSDARRIAEAIIQGQVIGQNIKIEVPASSNGKFTFKELPRPLSYYYQPHKYVTIPGGFKATFFEWWLPDNHVLHIHQVANNFFMDTYSDWIIDGVRFEKVERWISSLNAPLNVKDRYIVAYKNVKWITFNKGKEDIISEVLIDGVVYLLDDWKSLLGSKI